CADGCVYGLDRHSFPPRRSSDLGWSHSSPSVRMAVSTSQRCSCHRRGPGGLAAPRPVGATAGPVLSIAAALPSFRGDGARRVPRSEEHTSELQSRENLVCRLLLE